MTDAERRQLAEEHISYARALTRCFVTRQWINQQYDEYEAVAMAQLWPLALAYDPAAGIPFAGFARKRIWGALYDHRRWLKCSSDRSGYESDLEFAVYIDDENITSAARLHRDFDLIDLQADIEATIARMPAQLRALAQRLLLDGLTQAEAAHTMGLSRGYTSRLNAKLVEWLARCEAQMAT